MNEAGNNGNIGAETVPLREKLRLIRDSDHPAAPWARNVVQCLDAMPHKPNDPVAIRYLGKNVAMLQRAAIGALNEEATILTPDEIAAIFGLGEHPGTDQ